VRRAVQIGGAVAAMAVITLMFEMPAGASTPPINLLGPSMTFITLPGNDTVYVYNDGNQGACYGILGSNSANNPDDGAELCVFPTGSTDTIQLVEGSQPTNIQI